jgi:hypothetical protein
MFTLEIAFLIWNTFYWTKGFFECKKNNVVIDLLELYIYVFCVFPSFWSTELDVAEFAVSELDVMLRGLKFSGYDTSNLILTQ